jgi:cytochrome c-type biogenesis protein CcmH/NrfF
VRTVSPVWILAPLGVVVIGVAILVAAVARIVRRERAAEEGLDDRTDEPWLP